jgi:hypothetical protein
MNKDLVEIALPFLKRAMPAKKGWQRHASIACWDCMFDSEGRWQPIRKLPRTVLDNLPRLAVIYTPLGFYLDRNMTNYPFHG